MSKVRAHVTVGLLATTPQQEAALAFFEDWELIKVFATRNSLNEAQMVYVFERHKS